MESSFTQSISPQYPENRYAAQMSRTKVYVCLKSKLIFSIIFIWLRAFAISALVVMLGATITSGVFTLSILAIIVISALTIASVFTPIFSMRYNKRIEINLDGITFYRIGRKCAHYPLNSQFTSYVEAEYGGNSLTVGTRSLKITLPDGKYFEESLNCFPKDTLAELVADINNLRRYGKFDNRENAVAAAPAAPNSLQARFIVPKQQLNEGEKEYATTPVQIVILTLACAGIIPPLLYFMNILPKDYFWALVLFFLVFVPIMAGVGSRLEKKDVNNCPGCIELYSDRLQIDNTSFPIADIGKITMTPPTYNATKYGLSRYRYLKIFTKNGEAEYPLGRTEVLTASVIYSDYESLRSSFQAWCFDQNIGFFDELG